MQREGMRELFQKHRRRVGLRMAPMIDIIFLLLLFFLVAAKWRPQENFLPFQLPTAQAAERNTVKPEPMQIFLFAEDQGFRVKVADSGMVNITDKNMAADLAVLMEEVKKKLTDQKRFATDPIEIICEQDVKWDYLVKTYNLFYGTGLTDITFRMTE